MKNAACRWLTIANAPAALSEMREAIHKPAMPTEMPSSSSLNKGQVTENSAGRAGALRPPATTGTGSDHMVANALAGGSVGQGPFGPGGSGTVVSAGQGRMKDTLE